MKPEQWSSRDDSTAVVDAIASGCGTPACRFQPGQGPFRPFVDISTGEKSGRAECACENVVHGLLLKYLCHGLDQKRSARREVLLEACAAICAGCSRGAPTTPFVPQYGGPGYIHADAGWCNASEIRLLMAKEGP